MNCSNILITGEQIRLERGPSESCCCMAWLFHQGSEADLFICSRRSYSQDRHIFHVAVSRGIIYLCMAEEVFGPTSKCVSQCISADWERTKKFSLAIADMEWPVKVANLRDSFNRLFPLISLNYSKFKFDKQHLDLTFALIQPHVLEFQLDIANLSYISYKL